MAGSRVRGPLGGNGSVAIGFGPRDSTYASRAGLGEEPLAQEELEMLWDVAQLILDIVTAAESTHSADTSSSVVSLTRGNWLGASLSMAGEAPYINDLSKVGKFSASSIKVRRAVEVARTSPRFAQRLRPLLQKLYLLLDRIPQANLARSAQMTIDGLKRDLEGYLLVGATGTAPRAVLRSAKLPPGTVVPPSRRPRAFKSQHTHAEVRHDYTGNVEFDNKSKFDSVSAIDEVIERSAHYDAIVAENGNYVVAFDTRVVTGWDAHRRRQTTSATVIMKPNGEVVTVHPGAGKMPLPKS